MLLQVKTVIMLLGAVLVLFLLTEFVSYKMMASENETGPWKGYYQLICENEHTSQKIENLLNKRGIKDVISENSEKVSVFSYTGEKVIPLSDVTSVFLPEDPLFDHYLKKLNSYFTGTYGKKHVRVMYFPAAASPFRTYLLLKSLLRGVDGWWKYVNFIPLQKLFLFFILGAGEGILFKLAGSKKKFAVAAAAWIFPLVLSGFFGTVLALGFQFLWIMVLNRFIPFYVSYLDYQIMDKSLVKKIVLKAAVYIVLCLSLCIVLRGTFSPGTIALSMFIQLWGTAALLGYLYFRYKSRGHKLFTPVPIKKP